MKRRWTEEEVLNLRSWWTHLSVSTIAKRLHRSMWSVYRKAFRSGIAHDACQGLISVNEACRVFGFNQCVIRSMVKVWRPGSVLKKGRKYGYVDPDDLRDAVNLRLNTETMRQAARARGVSFNRLRTNAARAGYVAKNRGVPLRLFSSVWDAIAAIPLPKQEQQERAASSRTSTRARSPRSRQKPQEHAPHDACLDVP